MIKTSADFYLWSGSSPESMRKLKSSIKGMGHWPLNLHFNRQTLNWASDEDSDPRFYLSGTDQHRAQTLLHLLEEPRVENIFCTRGGYGALRILPELERMKIKPSGRKIVWGYSDTTIVQLYLHQRFGWQWVHSPMLCSQSWQEPDAKEKRSLKALFNPKGFQYQKALKIWHLGRGLPSSIKVVGGNLMCLVSMLSGDWLRAPQKPYFLFLEDINEAHYRLDRLLVILSQSKYFKNCRGILLGHFTDCPGHQEILRLWAKENKLFMASRIDAGHESPNVPLILGDNWDFKKENASNVLARSPLLKLEVRGLK
jgi:muramoyltetrapeptide carboxypeptidase